MERKKDTPKAALREMMGDYLKENYVKVKDGTEVNSSMWDMMSIILEVPWIRRGMRSWDIPRDRKGEFEPKMVKKYQNTVTQDMEEKLLSAEFGTSALPPSIASNKNAHL